MYLLGHTAAKFTMRVYPQVLDVGADAAKQLTELLGASPEDAPRPPPRTSAGLVQGTSCDSSELRSNSARSSQSPTNAPAGRLLRR